MLQANPALSQRDSGTSDGLCAGAEGSRYAVLIPARRIEPALEPQIRRLLASGIPEIILVDDGSGPGDQPVFEHLASIPGVHLLQHTVNRGKGRALKTGLEYFHRHLHGLQGVITVDADGQHAVADVLRVIAAMRRSPEHPVFGCREFGATVPLRSRLGNLITRVVFRLLFQQRIKDTQTGLRGFPASLVPNLMKLRGERYEYEMIVLCWLCRAGTKPHELQIETIYFDNNSSSSFRPLRDSLRIYQVLFALSVFKTFVED